VENEPATDTGKEYSRFSGIREAAIIGVSTKPVTVQGRHGRRWFGYSGWYAITSPIVLPLHVIRSFSARSIVLPRSPRFDEKRANDRNCGQNDNLPFKHRATPPLRSAARSGLSQHALMRLYHHQLFWHFCPTDRARRFSG